MKKYVLIPTLLLIMSSTTMISQQKFMSFNVRFDNPADGEDRWELRKEELCGLIQKHDPDFLGVQEALPGQVTYLDAQLKDYAYIGFGRDGAGTPSESVPIFYKSQDYELLRKEVFWLSETPEKPSKGWDAALNRITTYGIFLNRQTQDTVHVFNTHFDHRGEKARLNSSHLLISKLRSLKLLKEKVILMGDFNSRPEEDPIRILTGTLTDACTSSADQGNSPSGTFNGFDIEIRPDHRIDYVFVLNFRVLSCKALNEKRKNGRWISDHLPVLVEVTH